MALNALAGQPAPISMLVDVARLIDDCTAVAGTELLSVWFLFEEFRRDGIMQLCGPGQKGGRCAQAKQGGYELVHISSW